MNRLVGAITIGQAPRPDLLAPLLARLPGDVEVVEVGALDGLAADDLPRAADLHHPLATRLRDGTPVTLDEAFLVPLVQAAVDAADARCVEATLLLCAASFAAVRSRRPLVRPLDAAVSVLRRAGAGRIVVVVPVEAQAAWSEAKWREAGFDPLVIVGDLSLADAAGRISAMVLDYVGHATEDVVALHRALGVPLVDLGEAGADAAAARFR